MPSRTAFETSRDPRELTAEAFNACITARDLEGIGRLMTSDYTFIDSAGTTERGKDAGIAAWRGFFARFPDYRNVFRRIAVRDDLVIAIGHSICAEPALRGPAIWTARVRGGRVAEWRVYEDTPETRARLAI
jgi:ketosteroid isomerase-like protein